MSATMILFGLALLIPLIVKVIMKKRHYETGKVMDFILIVMFVVGVIVLIATLFNGGPMYDAPTRVISGA